MRSDPGSDQASSGFATTLARGLAVLECFAPDAPLLGNTAIAERVGLSRPTVARLTSTLAELGYLKYDRRAAKFRLGSRVLTLAHPLLATLRLRQVARPLMQEFAISLPGVVSVGILEGTSHIYVESARASEYEAHIPDIGSTLPLVRTAMGRALVSMLPKDEVNPLVAILAEQDPVTWEEYKDRFFQGVEDCAARGFCTSPGDLIDEVHGVSAPLFRLRGQDTLAINCSIAAFRLRPGELNGVIGPRLLALTRRLRVLMEEHYP